MSGELRLDLAGLRERAARLADIADRVKQTHAGLQDCLNRAEGSWGDDHMGRAFADQFTPHADQVLANVQAMQEHLRSTAAGINSTANEFGVQDADNAARVAGAADAQGPGADNLTGSWPNDVAGPSSPGDVRSPVPSDRAGLSPEQSSARYPARGASRTEQHPPGGQQLPGGQQSVGSARSPEGSQGRAVPNDDRPSRAPWSRSRPETGPDSRDAAGESGNRSRPASAPPSAAVSPPRGRRDARRTPGGPTGSRAAGPVGQRETPWTGQPPGTTAPPRMPGAPGNSGSPGNTGTDPQHRTPPRPNTPSGDKARERDRRGTRERPASDPSIVRLARALAERHSVQVAGFDSPGLQLAAVQDFVTAVDRVLTDYPMIALDIVAVAELDDEFGIVRWSCEPPDDRDGTTSMTLDRRTAQTSTATGRTTESDEPTPPDIYPATLRAFGRALDAAGGGVARRQAQRALIAEYLHTQAPLDSTLAAVVRGYRDWRAELAGNATAPGEFDVDEALGIAFATVVQHGETAGIQARLLHAVLVAAASRPG